MHIQLKYNISKVRSFLAFLAFAVMPSYSLADLPRFDGVYVILEDESVIKLPQVVPDERQVCKAPPPPSTNPNAINLGSILSGCSPKFSFLPPKQAGTASVDLSKIDSIFIRSRTERMTFLESVAPSNQFFKSKLSDSVIGVGITEGVPIAGYQNPFVAAKCGYRPADLNVLNDEDNSFQYFPTNPSTGFTPLSMSSEVDRCGQAGSIPSAALLIRTNFANYVVWLNN